MIGDRLKELREDNKMTQEELAIILNVSRQSISGYEADLAEPTLDNLVKVADMFDVSLDYLLGRTKEKININIFAADKQNLLLEIIKSLDKYTITKNKNRK